MSSMLFSIVIFLTVLPSNISEGISVRPRPIVTSLTPRTPEKAAMPTEVTESGMESCSGNVP